MFRRTLLGLGVTRALVRARFGILTVGVAHLLALTIGVSMVHAGNHFALSWRDKLVADSVNRSVITGELLAGHRFAATGLDFAANSMAGLATTLAGYWAPAVYPICLYRGWIGGIVSVDANHNSRFQRPAERRYYLLVLFLQLLPYILAGGAGVNIGLARVRPVGDYGGAKFFGVPRESIKDAARIYALALPLFAVASFYEFFAVAL